MQIIFEYQRRLARIPSQLPKRGVPLSEQKAGTHHGERFFARLSSPKTVLRKRQRSAGNFQVRCLGSRTRVLDLSGVKAENSCYAQVSNEKELAEKVGCLLGIVGSNKCCSLAKLIVISARCYVCLFVVLTLLVNGPVPVVSHLIRGSKLPDVVPT